MSVIVVILVVEHTKLDDTVSLPVNELAARHFLEDEIQAVAQGGRQVGRNFARRQAQVGGVDREVVGIVFDGVLRGDLHHLLLVHHVRIIV